MDRLLRGNSRAANISTLKPTVVDAASIFTPKPLDSLDPPAEGDSRGANISTEERSPADADNQSSLTPSIQKFDNEFPPSGLSAEPSTHRQAQGGEEDRTTMPELC